VVQSEQPCAYFCSVSIPQLTSSSFFVLLFVCLLLFILCWLLIPAQLIAWKDSSRKLVQITYFVSSGTHILLTCGWHILTYDRGSCTALNGESLLQPNEHSCTVACWRLSRWCMHCLNLLLLTDWLCCVCVLKEWCKPGEQSVERLLLSRVFLPHHQRSYISQRYSCCCCWLLLLLVLTDRLYLCMYAVSENKTPTQSFCDNFGKCAPVLIILSLLHSTMNCRRRYCIVRHLASNLLPHYLAKFECLSAELYMIVIHSEVRQIVYL